VEAADPGKSLRETAPSIFLEAKHGIRVKHLYLERDARDTSTSRRIRWYNARAGENDKIVAIEHRAVIDPKTKETKSMAKLEIIHANFGELEQEEVADETVALLLAVWIARLRQEGIYEQRGHLTSQLSKWPFDMDSRTIKTYHDLVTSRNEGKEV
jgi:hypothetical protein